MKLLSLILLLCSAIICFGSKASWYGDDFQGKIMSNGQKFDKYALTCASRDYPLGTKLRLSHLNKSVVVTVTDRINKRYKNRIDLSEHAFSILSNLNKGIIDVNIEIVK